MDDKPSNMFNRLRIFLICFITVCAMIGMGIWITSIVNHTAVIRQIERNNGYVAFDDQNFLRSAYYWVYLNFDIDCPTYFLSVECIGLTNLTPPTRREISNICESIAHLKKVQYIDLRYSPLNDFDLAKLVHLKHLEELDISHTDITDKGASSIAKLHSLIFLDLSGTKITNDTIKKLKPLSNLKEIWVNETSISNEGLRYLSDLPRIENFSIGETKVTMPDEEIMELFPDCGFSQTSDRIIEETNKK